MIKNVIRLLFLIRFFPIIFRSRQSMLLEIAALRQQIGILKRSMPQVKVKKGNRVFWVMMRKCWTRWRSALLLFKPHTVVEWHRLGFKLFWRLRSRQNNNESARERKREIRRLIIKLAMDNLNWGAPRIHGEMLKLGFRVSERTVSRYLPKRKLVKDRQNKWLAFLRNHRHAFAAMDFFTLPTLFFRQLYCFFVIGHNKRAIIHFNVTFHPNAAWVKNQLENAFAKSHAIKYMIYDRDSIFSPLIKTTLKSLGIDAVRTSYQSPWQNGIAERFVGNVRREMLDHVIIINRVHLYRLMREYIDYYHDDRTHYALNKETPYNRPIQVKPTATSKIVGIPKLGGLHHRYVWKDAA